jgi:cysteine desulfurase / selenocysteine lyase
MTTVAKRPVQETPVEEFHPAGAPAADKFAADNFPAVNFDVQKVRDDFPILRERVHGKKLVYLDNAATSQKPQVVIDTVRRYYERDNANIHRGVHFLSERATEEYEGAREDLRSFLNAADASEIVFVRGATEAVNLVAQTYGRSHVEAGDEVLITAMEHHSNIVPWQILCEEKRARLRVVPINDSGELMLEDFARLLGPRTKIVAVAHVSNALGTVNPIGKMIEMAHRENIPVLVDGAQAVPHLKVDVQALGCDFYVASGHKMYGPTGIGMLYGKAALLDAMPPYQGGGDMISSVTFEKTIYNKLPYKFEAGTPHIAGGIGLGAAVGYINRLGIGNIAAYEHELLAYATEAVSSIDGIRLIGTAREKAGVLSFLLADIHPHDIGTILDREGIAIRTGHHCAQPVMQCFGIAATARASFALYNTKEEVDALVDGIQKVREVFI